MDDFCPRFTFNSEWKKQQQKNKIAFMKLAFWRNWPCSSYTVFLLLLFWHWRQRYSSTFWIIDLYTVINAWLLCIGFVNRYSTLGWKNPYFSEWWNHMASFAPKHTLATDVIKNVQIAVKVFFFLLDECMPELEACIYF